MPIFDSFSLPDVDKLKAAHDTSGLITALNYKRNKSFLWFQNLWDPTNWRVWERENLLRGFRNFIVMLRIAGSTADLRIRAEAAEALSEIGSEQAVKALTVALSDSYNDDRVLSAIRKALEKIQRPN